MKDSSRKNILQNIFQNKNWVVAGILSLLTAVVTSDRWTYFFLHKYFNGLVFIVQVIILLMLALIYFPFFSLLVYEIKKAFSYFFRSEDLADLLPKPSNPVNQRIIKIIGWIGLGFACIYLINNLFGQIDLFTLKFNSPINDIRMDLVGNDFRVGIYEPAKALVTYFNIYPVPDGTYITMYPPLVNVIGLPFLLFNENDAVVVQMILIFLMNIACVGISLLLVNKIFFSKIKANASYIQVLNLFLFIILSFFAVSSYPFLFSLERGNYDIAAIFFSLLGIWCVLTKPEKVWLQVILISIAFHLKLYPGILFVLLLYKHGKKFVLPLIVVNLFLLFIIGPQNAIGFINTTLSTLAHPHFTKRVFNSSGVAFAGGLVGVHPELASMQIIMTKIFTYLPLLFWLISLVFLYKIGKTQFGEVLFFVISVPPMLVIPSISYDYKIVIFTSALVIILGLIIYQYIQSSKTSSLIDLVICLCIFLFSTKYFDVHYQVPFLLNSKYPIIIAAQIFMLVLVIKARQMVCADKKELATAESI